MIIFRKIKNKLQDLYVYSIIFFQKRILFKDKFGLTYYLYKNTRPTDAFRRGVRTDDTSVLAVIKEIISSNSELEEINCIDVGAFIGVVTLMMAKELNSGNSNWKIHSFEPYKQTFSRLKENIELSQHIENIELNNVGLADKSGVQKMAINENAPGTNSLVSSSSIAYDELNEVAITTLYEYLKQRLVRNILLCKIDAEGVNDLVLNGMNSYLNDKKVDYLILEYENKISQRKIKKILDKYQYKIFYMVRNKNYLVNNMADYPKNNETLINILAVSSLANLEPINSLLEPCQE